MLPWVETSEEKTSSYGIIVLQNVLPNEKPRGLLQVLSKVIDKTLGIN